MRLSYRAGNLHFLYRSLSGYGYCEEINWIPEPLYLIVKSRAIF